MSVEVSIIMPSFNSSRFISESINSVIGQTFKDWELIICDDGSDDDSLEIINSFVNSHSNIYLVSNNHGKGAPGARNACLERSKGRFIAFLDSDDIWLKEKLDRQISFMKENSYSFSYSYIHVINEEGVFKNTYKAPGRVNSNNMKYSNFIPCLTAVYDSSYIGKVYQPNLKRRNDFALWLKILNTSKCKEAFCLKQVTAKYRQNSYGLSSSRLDALKYYFLCQHNFNKAGRLHSLYLTAIYIAISIFKRYLTVLFNFFIIRL